MTKYVLLRAGCPECLDSPLIEVWKVYDTLEEAKASENLGDRYRWKEHYQGGVHYEHGSGGVWIAPLSVLMEGDVD